MSRSPITVAPGDSVRVTFMAGAEPVLHGGDFDIYASGAEGATVRQQTAYEHLVEELGFLLRRKGAVRRGELQRVLARSKEESRVLDIQL